MLGRGDNNKRTQLANRCDRVRIRDRHLSKVLAIRRIYIEKRKAVKIHLLYTKN